MYVCVCVCVFVPDELENEWMDFDNQSPRKIFFQVLPKFGSCMYVLCMYVGVCVFAITATPFNLELSNFGITFLM